MKAELGLTIILAAASLISDAKIGSPSPQKDEYPLNYAKFSINVSRTPTHEAYEVDNGILLESPGGRGGVMGSTLQFCEAGSQIPVEVPITDTDYMEKDKAITLEEEKGKVPPSPFYRAKPEEKTCELVTQDGKIIEAVGVKK